MSRTSASSTRKRRLFHDAHDEQPPLTPAATLNTPTHDAQNDQTPRIQPPEPQSPAPPPASHADTPPPRGKPSRGSPPRKTPPSAQPACTPPPGSPMPLPGDTPADDALDAASAKQRKRHRSTRKVDEADLAELKPRRRQGRKSELLVARSPAVSRGGASGAATPAGEALADDAPSWAADIGARLNRTLRPKLRRWAAYEWLYSPVDHTWFHSSDFARKLRECGMGIFSRLTRREWSFLRAIFAPRRRFSPAFIAEQRAGLEAHRAAVRSVRRIGGPLLAAHEAQLGLTSSSQLAVGQRVTALNPRDRHMHSGVILTPDDDDYKVQFDSAKQGVATVPDYWVMPLVDGTAGVDFASQRGQARPPALPVPDLASAFADDDAAAAPAEAGPASQPIKGGGNEAELLAYILRLLTRKDVVTQELHRIAKESEEELFAFGEELARAGVDAPDVYVVRDTPSMRVEVTAAQQRQLGQVPPLPLLPQLGQLIHHGKLTSAEVGERIVSTTERRRCEIHWLQRELTNTNQRLETALHVMRPFAQHVCLAIGTVAPEPQTQGLTLAETAGLRTSVDDSTAVILARCGAEAAELSGAARERAAAVCSLLLQLRAWAMAPQSPEECRLALVGSLQRLRPKAAGRGDGARFEAIVQRTQQLMSIVSGTGIYKPDSAANK